MNVAVGCKLRQGEPDYRSGFNDIIVEAGCSLGWDKTSTGGKSCSSS